MKLSGYILAFSAVGVLVTAPPAAAQKEGFYKGKTLQILVASGPGAGNDLKTRIFARHAPKYLPGAPTIVVENMPGAGGLRARNHLYNLVKPDGLTIAQIVRGTELQEAIGDPGVKYKADRFHWIGNLTTGDAICAVRIDRGGETLQEAIKRSASTPLRNAESGSSSIGAVAALLVKQFTGLNLQVVAGYAGGSAIDLAIERGEADMRCGLIWSSARARHADWFKQFGSTKPFAAAIVQIAEKRIRELADVSTLIELAPDKSWRAVAETISFTYENAYPMLGPPGLPEDTVKLLRKAFWETVHDAEYIAESKKAGFPDDEPLPGDKVQRTVKQILDVPDDAKMRLRKLLGMS
jgi:tripartite-type tricarboxylate transporter receptor subunit TctC